MENIVIDGSVNKLFYFPPYLGDLNYEIVTKSLVRSLLYFSGHCQQNQLEGSLIIVKNIGGKYCIVFYPILKSSFVALIFAIKTMRLH